MDAENGNGNGIKNSVKSETVVKILSKMIEIEKPVSKNYLTKECNVDYNSIQKVLDELIYVKRVEEVDTTAGILYRLLK